MLRQTPQFIKEYESLRDENTKMADLSSLQDVSTNLKGDKGGKKEKKCC
jgi:hypothetical protein